MCPANILNMNSDEISVFEPLMDGDVVFRYVCREKKDVNNEWNLGYLYH